MKLRKLEKRILRQIIKANRDFEMFGPGDRILLAISGGKDSWALLWALTEIQKSAPFHFDIVAYHLDQGIPGHDSSTIDAHLKAVKVPYEVEHQHTWERTVEKTTKGKSYCSLCSRFRRAILYKAAERHNCNKVALGHHRDDIIETLMMNILFSGQIKTMPPRLKADNGNHEVIRPMAYVREEHIITLAEQHEFPIKTNTFCNSKDSQRVYVKKMIKDLDEYSHHISGNILSATGNITLSHLLDKRLNPLFNGAEGALALGEDPEVDDDEDSALSLPAEITTLVNDESNLQ
ncbi:tRNA 2-thiocytidine(32) synthetase TtcA [Myxococcota bacterium]|nr:tRNA 2-thiocytidine(32) synthetase TtcA [Myxococcota bacterium]